MKKLVIFSLCALFLSGCAQQGGVKRDMSAFLAASPHSIVVAPVVNKSLDVDAPNYVLSALPVPLAERGYYVFPVHTSKVVLEQEGYYEGEQVHALPAETLAKLFGADAVLYVTINRWDAQYIILSTSVTVEFDYKIVGRDGTELWRDRQRLVYTPNSSGGLLGAVINAAVERAAPNYMPLTRRANGQAFIGVPAGPYRKENK